MSYLSMIASQNLHCRAVCDEAITCCHPLIEWWLFWTGPPVLSLCENMLMQIDANDAVLYMQISHATILVFFFFLFFKDKHILVIVCACRCIWVMFGCMSGLFFEKITTSRKLQIESIHSPINLRSPCRLHCMSQYCEWKTLLRGLKDGVVWSFWCLICTSSETQI